MHVNIAVDHFEVGSGFQVCMSFESGTLGPESNKETSSKVHASTYVPMFFL